MGRKIYNKFYIMSPAGIVLTELGEEFKQAWLSSHGDGAQVKIAQEFGVSIPTVYRMRKDLELPDLHSKEHPGRRDFHKRVIELYRRWGSSTRVARAPGINLSGQRVIQILKEHRVTLSEQHIANPLLYSPMNGMTPNKFNETVKRLYQDGVTAKQIAEQLGVDQGTVSKRLKHMTSSHQLKQGVSRW
jgi:transposase